MYALHPSFVIYQADLKNQHKAHAKALNHPIAAIKFLFRTLHPNEIEKITQQIIAKTSIIFHSAITIFFVFCV